jgi:GT2 family glycosyltransferase
MGTSRYKLDGGSLSADQIAPRPQVSILVPVHETIGEAAALLESIVRHTTGPYEIVVVDNGSGETARQPLASLTSSHGGRLVRVEHNLVYGGAVNRGLSETRGVEVCVLNSDVVVTPNWLTNLRAALHSSPDVAIVGPRSNCARWMQGGVWLDDTSTDGIERYGRFFNHSDPSRWFDIDWLSGYAMLFEAADVRSIGGFDEVPWFAGEDRMLCERLRSGGSRVMCAGDTFVFHAGHRTFAHTGLNRTATRLGATATPAVGRDLAEARLVRDGSVVYEVADGIARHLENGHIVRLIRRGRPLEWAQPGELESLLLGPPVATCRVRATDDVWVTDGTSRQLVTGDPQRIRRLQAISIVEPDQLAAIPRGEDVAIEGAFPAVPEIDSLLAPDSTAISRERLASAETVIAEIGSAVERGCGHATIALHRQAVLVLNDRMWPADDGEWWLAGVGDDATRAAAEIRRAIIDADCVGVVTDRTGWDPASLLERLLFHYDLYPRVRYPAEIVDELLGVDPRSGEGGDGGRLLELLADRAVAVACPADVAEIVNRHGSPRATGARAPRLAVSLDDLADADRALVALAAQRESFDAVLVGAGVAGIRLCTRLARELDVPAIDVGHALDGLLGVRASEGAASVACSR